MNNELIERYESLLKSTNRDGIDKLIEFIRRSDFYTAPASTRFHNCHECGLLEHSLNVYDCLYNKVKNTDVFKNALSNSAKEFWDTDEFEKSIAIIALLHDLCKTFMYEVEMKNKKIYSDHGKKSDSQGRYDWESVPGYTVNDRVPYGHGEKSVMMIEQFITLTKEERFAIRWHMGFTEPKENWNTLSAAIRLYPIILAVHEADLEATYMLEKEE